MSLADLRLTRHFSIPRSLIFQTLTRSEHIQHWFAPEGFRVSTVQCDPRPEGLWSIAMTGPDHQTVVTGGQYQEVRHPEHLLFTQTWSDPQGNPGPETTVSLSLEAIEGSTTLHLVQYGFQTESERDGHRQGWLSAFETLAGYAARQVQKVGLI